MFAPRLTDALTACEQALEPSFSPADFTLACQKLGNLLQGMGRFEDATLWHTQATAAEPDWAQIYGGVGRVYVLQKQWPEAIAAFRKALQHNPNYAEAYWKLGAIALQQGQRNRALYCWYHALRLEPLKATLEGHLQLGHAFLKANRLDYALACYQRAIRMHRKQDEGYRQLADTLKGQRRWEEAIAVYSQAVKHLPEPGWAYYELGALLRKRGRLEEAIVAFDTAVEHDPDFPWARHDCIQMLLNQHRWDEAVCRCRAALDHKPFPWAYSQLGRAFTATGDRDGAIACHQSASTLRGWNRCAERNYQFTQDWFTHNIPLWESQLKPWMNAPDMHMLEIGSFQGMSACWLLDTVLTHPTSRLTCIDPNFQPEFSLNLARTGAADRVTVLTGNSHDLLPTLAPQAEENAEPKPEPEPVFDLIYIDGCHLAHHVRRDGVLAWPLLKPGGLMIFDDYLWSDPRAPQQDPKLGIDGFLKTVEADAQILHRDYQVIVRKASPAPC